MRKLDAYLAAALVLTGCSTLAHRTGADEKPVEIFTSGRRPTKPFVEVTRIDMYVEKWNRDEPSMEDFRPELESRARLSGADAVIDLEWTLKGTAETGVYHVRGKGIAYSARPGQPEPAARVEPPGAPASTSGALAEARPPMPGLPGGDIEIISGAPVRPFIKVSHLDLYVEKRAAGEPALEEVLPELKRQARLSGAEAVMDVEWTLRGTNDAGVYHVTATGIAYSGPAATPAPAAPGQK